MLSKKRFRSTTWWRCRFAACSVALALLFSGLGLAQQATTHRRATKQPGTAKTTPAKPQTTQPSTPKPVAKPDFSGEWRMNAAQSDFATFPKPTSILRTVTQKDNDLVLNTVQRASNGEQTATVRYNLDGSQSTNQLSSGLGTSHAFWDGNTLVIRTTMTTRSNLLIDMEERWDLSADGKTLVTASHIETSKGATDLKLVCDRVGKS